MSIDNRSNIFNLEMFDQWVVSDSAMAIKNEHLYQMQNWNNRSNYLQDLCKENFHTYTQADQNLLSCIQNMKLNQLYAPIDHHFEN